MPRVCVPLASGFEEIEAVTIIDVLRRADVDVLALGLDTDVVTGSHGIAIAADGVLADHAREDFDLVVLPGGMPGSATLRDDPRVQELLRRQHGAGRPLAAMCAAPIALAAAGVLKSRRATSYPSFADQLGEVEYSEERVVCDGNVTTSRAPGTALEFALALVEQLQGAEVAASLRVGMLVDSGG